ncbi:MAG: hypothetical protein ACYTEO_13785 [Planctomycetota bacterium]
MSLILIIPFILPSAALSKMKIVLKNGRSIIAESCRHSNGRLLCSKMGGSFYIEKKDILDIKEITVEQKDISVSSGEVSGTGTDAAEEKKEDSDIKQKALSEPQRGVLVRGKDPVAEKRLDEINQRKQELMTGRDRLIQETEQLNKKIIDTGEVKTEEESAVMTKQINEIEEKINRFNSEVKALREEENSILEALRGKQ